MKTKKGFTLIELLVVISIIALLLSILMPSLQRVKQSARKVVCLSNCRQWALAASAYASENDDYYPMRGSKDWETYSQYSWPWQYYKVAGDWVYADLISSFFKPYMNESSFIFCPSVPEGDPAHSKNGVSIVNKSWDRIIEIVLEAGGSHPYLDGDYSLFTGYDLTGRELLKVTGGGVRWGGVLPVPPDYIEEPRDLDAKPPSPIKASRTRPETAISSDRAFYVPSGEKYLSNHPYLNFQPEEPEGFCAAFAGGNSHWVEFEDFYPFMQYTDSRTFYWPRPFNK